MAAIARKTAAEVSTRTPSLSSRSNAKGVARGTQAVERAIAILRELATRGGMGWSLGSLAERCGLDPATAHRILQALRDEGFVQQRRQDRHYVLGSLAFELGVTMVAEARFQSAMRSRLRRLVREMSRVVAIGYLRSGENCVCVAREGRSPYSRDDSGIHVGHMGPLLSLAGGIAILAALPVPEANAVIARNEKRLVHLGRSHLAQIRRLALRCLGESFVQSDGTVWQGIHSIAVAVTKTNGSAIGALVASAMPGTLSDPQFAAVVRHLQAAARDLRTQADALSPDGSAPSRCGNRGDI